jgi:hypothetical protein
MGLFDKQKPPQTETDQGALQADRSRIASFLNRARTFNGTGPEDPTLKISLRTGERALLVATGTFLVEPRRVQGYWAGGSGGFAFQVPLKAGRADGSQVAGDAGLAPVDTGDLTFTDQRIVFAGSHQQKEWGYSALLGFDHSDDPPWTALALKGQDRVSGFRYDEGQAGEIRFAIVLGVARFNNSLDSLVADIQEQLDEFDRAHPGAGASAPSPAGVPSPSPQGAPPQVMERAGAQAAWPPTSPFGAVPAAGSAGSAGSSQSGSPGSGSESATWGDPAKLAPTGAAADPSTNSDLQKTGVLAADAAPPPEQGVPTGEIPAVALSPTATYPSAMAQQAAAPAQSYQTAQPVHGGQSQARPAAGAPNTPPGWYPDPWRVTRVRWWDGYSWTSYTSN